VGIVIEEVAKKRILRASTTKFPVRKGSLYKKCDDSKILTEAKRDSIYEELTQNSQFHGTTGRVSAKDIDRH
jgi:ribonuclease HII